MKVILIWFNNKHKALCFWRIREKENWKLLVFFIYFFCQINKPIFITYWLLSVDIHDSKKEKRVSLLIYIVGQSSSNCPHTLVTEGRALSCTRRSPGPTPPAKGLTVGLRISSWYHNSWHVSPVSFMCITCGQCEFALIYNDNRAPVGDLRILMFSSECQLSCMVLGC